MSRSVKIPEQSKAVMSHIVMPNHTNTLGNLMGGKLLHMIDIVGALSASRHASSNVVTAYIGEVTFKEPIKLGDVVELHCKVIWVGNTSMEVKVEVFRENIKTGDRILANDALLVFVALDDYGKPRQVPDLLPQTQEEQELYTQAKARRGK